MPRAPVAIETFRPDFFTSVNGLPMHFQKALVGGLCRASRCFCARNHNKNRCPGHGISKCAVGCGHQGSRGMVAWWRDGRQKSGGASHQSACTLAGLPERQFWKRRCPRISHLTLSELYTADFETSAFPDAPEGHFENQQIVGHNAVFRSRFRYAGR